ncbi:DUF1835 domain-containing protein [Mucilaginibacter terrae]|uniref:DUF1835 domain-containing protein n=1 Tax=Mucilaginibacter terrae TaxID=1955052 RepID=UPI0036397416
MNQLHILNGDATLTGFNQTGLDGEVLVWREVFSEGPLSVRLDADFWTRRANWISNAFEDAAGSYQENVLLELEKLNEPYEEINLWFEFDLHCQVNLLGVMQLLKQEVNLTAPALYLICPDSFPGVENFKGMGQLNGDQLEDLYDTRLHLTEYDFIIATEAWKTYIQFDAEALQQWIDATPFWGSLHLLKPALEAQVKRLQVSSGGLNFIEQKLLQFYQNGIATRNGLYQSFWSEAPIYGMGDAELDIYLKRLEDKLLIKLINE